MFYFDSLPCLRRSGPLSVTVHIPLPTSASKSSSRVLHNNLLALHALVTNSPSLSTRADIHLVLSPFPRAFNTWRNIARLLARTTYILLLDVDFAVCTDWRASVRALLRDVKSRVARRVREGSAALVLPAFEYVKQAEGRNQDTFPRDRHVRTVSVFSPYHLSCRVALIDPHSHWQALLDLVRANRIAPFHASFSAGHNSTDYRRFYAAKPGGIYKVTQYQPAYEPYVVVKRDAGGWYVFLNIFESYILRMSVAGAMNDSLVMGVTKQLVCLRCIYRVSHSTYSAITSWYIKATRMKKRHAGAK